MNKKKKIILGAVAAIIIVVSGAAICYVNDYYHCEESALAVLEENEDVIVNEIKEGYFLDGPGNEHAMIFYPGAKVQAESYLPILYSLARQGVDSFLVKMPGNLAILGKDKADNILAEYEYDNWYMSGHSLGGAMAASYSAEHLDELAGIVLFAAYTTENLEADEFAVLSIYGSEDAILNMENMEKGRELVPEAYKEVCIEGGNHAYFGNYGEQDGDGTAVITREEQQEQAVNAMIEMITEEG